MWYFKWPFSNTTSAKRNEFKIFQTTAQGKTCRQYDR